MFILCKNQEPPHRLLPPCPTPSSVLTAVSCRLVCSVIYSKCLYIRSSMIRILLYCRRTGGHGIHRTFHKRCVYCTLSRQRSSSTFTYIRKFTSYVTLPTAHHIYHIRRTAVLYTAILLDREMPRIYRYVHVDDDTWLLYPTRWTLFYLYIST